MFLQKRLHETKDGEVDEEIKRFQDTLFSPVSTIDTQYLNTKVFEKELELFIQFGESLQTLKNYYKN